MEVAEDACHSRGGECAGLSFHHGANPDDKALERSDELGEQLGGPSFKVTNGSFNPLT